MIVQRFASASDLAEQVAALLAERFAAPCAEPRAIMLSGGGTPLAAYQILAQKSAPADPGLHLFLSDERMVPVDAPESNLASILPMALAGDIVSERILHVQTRLDLTEAAERYHQTLSDFFKSGGRVELGLLGLGDDGHTASLFSPADVARGAGLLAIAAPRHDGGPHRVSVTRDLLLRVERLIFLVAGAKKKEVATTFLQTPERLTAGVAVAGHENIEFWMAEID